MTVGNVGVNINPKSETKAKTNVVKGTLVAGAIGATASAAADVFIQNGMIKKAAKEHCVWQFPRTGKIFEFYNKEMIKWLDGKISTKMRALSALAGAAIIGGSYLVYRGINNLFSKNN